MNEKKRVVVTGFGAVTALGMNVSDIWTEIMAGKTGIKNLTCFDTTEYSTRIGAEVDNDKLAQRLADIKFKRYDRTVEMAIVSCEQALKHAGLIGDGPDYNPQRIATIIGTGVGSAHSLFHAYNCFFEKKVRGMRPTTVPRCMANATSAQVSMKFRLTGTNYMITCACASSTVAIGESFRMIADGYENIVLCGGSDAIFEPASYASWNNLGVMSKNPDPLKACRPFADDRDGCVLGEGSAALLLESLESAQSRKATILGEIVGYGASSDAEHITRPSPEGQANAIRNALSSAEISAAEIGFVNAHGTATRANDECESASILNALGSSADDTPVSALKSYFGHLLGASGAMETIITILCLQKNILPPNLNLENRDPNCHLCLVGNTPTETNASYALKNSFGFGGTNAVLVIRKWHD
ncbi:MAG: beta-ketoacyl-[acyl-carrier-protein] synthase family protein [Lentisphaerae bacterium]|nr:beta-ketoacyl-[acyl-carrier-protein] synthase family protein [Lentisphaerota bacterium]